MKDAPFGWSELPIDIFGARIGSRHSVGEYRYMARIGAMGRPVATESPAVGITRGSSPCALTIGESLVLLRNDSSPRCSTACGSDSSGISAPFVELEVQLAKSSINLLVGCDSRISHSSPCFGTSLR